MTKREDDEDEEVEDIKEEGMEEEEVIQLSQEVEREAVAFCDLVVTFMLIFI